MKIEITFRKATMEDAKILFEWRNDPDTRANSINTNKVPWEDHLNWLEKTLKTTKRELFIAEENNIAVGTVRVDRLDNNKCELSWTVAPEAREKGLGKKIVSLAVKIADKPLFAEIKPENIASIKIAQHAGFIQVSEDEKLTYWEIS